MTIARNWSGAHGPLPEHCSVAISGLPAGKKVFPCLLR